MKRPGMLSFLFLLSLAVLLGAPLIGGQAIPLHAVFHSEENEAANMIFWEIRLPRVCLAWLSGAGLAAAGMVFQAMFRNALATPFTLGVSSGASLGAAVGVRFGLTAAFLGFSGVSLCAMAGALLAIGIVYGLTRLKQDCSTGAMLLAGVAVNFFFSSLILLIQYTADFHDTFRILRWLMGGFQMVGFEGGFAASPPCRGAAILMASLVNELNLLTTGEEIAIGRGVPVHRVKTILFVSVSIMVGAIVSICGPVGFVGLMCPHIARLLAGASHRRLLPATLLFGGTFLVACDTVARTAFHPAELPVGIFTSFLGGPFFLWLLLRPAKGGSMAA